jgi:hypothetical protein
VVVIIAAAVFFLGMGVYALAAPDSLVAPFGITLGRATARAEVRAVYGGFGIAIAGVLAAAAVVDGPMRTGILITVGAALGGMAFGRAVSALIDGRMPWYPNWFYFAVEVIAGAALILVA